MTQQQGQHHVAGERDCMSSIAEQHGFHWKTLWMHGGNAELRRQRGNPNVLLAGDQVFIPARTAAEVICKCDARHRFVRKGVPAVLRLRFTKNDRPRAGVPYVLRIDGIETRGSTDGDGRIERPIPPQAQSGTLTLGSGVERQIFELELGAAAPVSEADGALARLATLGFHGGLDPDNALETALRSFQVHKDLAVTGELDAPTRDALAQAFGC